MDAALIELIEKNLSDSIEQAAGKIAELLCIPVSEFKAAVLTTFEPILHVHAETLVAGLTAGDTPEQFAERLAALNVKES